MHKDEFLERESRIAQQVDPGLFEAVESKVYEDPAVAANIERLRAAEAQGRNEEADRIADQNRTLVDNVRIRLLRASGAILNIEELEDESERQRKETLAEIHKGLTGKETETDLLQKFQLLGDKGEITRESIRSPLFRKRTSFAFSSYIAAVQSHIHLVDYMQMTGARSNSTDAVAADLIRTKAHDAVAKEVAEDLGLEFDAARRLVVKMRDGVVSSSGENANYAASAMRIGQKLSEQYGNRAAWLMESKTKSILKDKES